MLLAGWLLIVAGVVFMVVQAIRLGTFLSTSRNCEGAGFRFQTNWPGFEPAAVRRWPARTRQRQQPHLRLATAAWLSQLP
jgi:hypothetical protein